MTHNELIELAYHTGVFTELTEEQRQRLFNLTRLGARVKTYRHPGGYDVVLTSPAPSERLPFHIMAYGLLWRSPAQDQNVLEARKCLLNTLTVDERREGVKWVMETFGLMSTSELIAADIRTGIFPQKSYEPEEATMGDHGQETGTD